MRKTFEKSNPMLPANSTSILPASKPSFVSPSLLSRSLTISCRANDLPVGPLFPRWFQFPGAVDGFTAGGVQISRETECVAAEGSRRVAGNSKNSKANTTERKWSRDRESYLADDSDALPLPMTYPDSSPVHPEEIDRRLRCDPEVQMHSFKIGVWDPFFATVVWDTAAFAGRQKLLEREGGWFLIAALEGSWVGFENPLFCQDIQDIMFIRIASKWFMSGLECVEVAKGQDLSATTIKEGKRLSASAYHALELDMCKR